MANSAFSFCAYAQASTYDVLNGGYQLKGNGFTGPSYQNAAVVSTKVVAISPAQVYGTKFGNVTINSLVEVYPQGLQIPATMVRYLCSDLFSALVTART